MSLIEGMMEKCNILNHIRENDPYGDETERWTLGTSFDAAIIKDSSTQAVVAEQQGVKEIFTVVTKKGFSLNYHDVFQRYSDGQTFRVTSNVKGSEAPAASTVRIAKVTAEKWDLNDA